MARFTVFAPNGPDGLERAVFLRDGFSFAAFLGGPFWLFRHRCWFAGAAILFSYILIGVAVGALRLPGAVLPAILFLLQLLVGFEAAMLRGDSLSRGGYREIGIAVGSDREAMEQRFFAALEQSSDAPPASPTAQPTTTGVLGLFPSPNPAGMQTRPGRRP